MSNFTHLHVHTEYSILDGLAKIPQLIAKAYNDGQRAVAITDHGNMYGVFEFVKEVEKFNKSSLAIPAEPMKAIVGCEVYVAPLGAQNKSSKDNRSGRHLILLAKNIQGYRNLSTLVSIGFQAENFYYTPRVDMEILKKYSEGLIACSACLGGALPQSIMRYNSIAKNGSFSEPFDLEAAEEVIKQYLDIFGDDYYLEMQNHGHPEQTMVNKAIKQLSEKYNIPYIATNDVHFVNQFDFEAHKILLCINTGRDYTSPDSAVQESENENGLLYTGEEFLKTTEEMVQLFTDYPDAISNTQLIVDKIDRIKLSNPVSLPTFEVPEPFENENAYFEHLIYEGAHKRWPDGLTDEIKERIKFELDTVIRMGFPGYFLIVWDFINAGREMGIRFGPGRGSAAGSILAYCLNITNVDPIKYQLLFERFLNPDRISLPDMDIDIDDSGREKVIQYVIQKYGKDKVAQIVTFGTMAAKSSIRDCARVLKLPLSDSDRLAKLVPEGPNMTLAKAYQEVPELKNEMQNGIPLIKKTLDFAQQIEGTVKSPGVHACGVIIGKDPLINQIPLSTSKNSEIPVTQYEGKYVEDSGLLKMDFLGLKTLNIISSALINIKLRFNIDLDIDNIPLDDFKTYELLAKGDTIGVFQLESPGMRKYLIDLKPERFEDIIAMVSLYRPGPMDKIPSFINRKQGREPIVYDISEMSTYLGDTYGITIYQEQVMLLSRLLGGFTPGQADQLRKAMGKKLVNEMNSLESNFYDGGTKKGHDLAVLKRIWEEWKKFAEYAFNKSHATCYALVAYQTAYLKAHYPAEFLAAILTNNIDKIEEVRKFIEDAKHIGINVLPPDINESSYDFTVNKKGDIRFGLVALKGMGSAAVTSIIQERDKGKFENVFDFFKRINLKACNRKSIEALVLAGAFDPFLEIHRAQFLYQEEGEKVQFLDKLISWGNKQQAASISGQTDIFGETIELQNDSYPTIPNIEKWPPLEQLNNEKSIAGFYISGFPLDSYRVAIDNFCNVKVDELRTDKINTFKVKPAKFAAIITKVETGVFKKTGKEYGKVTVEDETGNWEWALFGESFTKFKNFLLQGRLLFIKAKTDSYFKKDTHEEVFKFVPIEIFYLDDIYEKLCNEVILSMNIKDVSPSVAYSIKETVESSPGKIPLSLKIVEENNHFYTDLSNNKFKVNPEVFVQNIALYVEYKIELK